MSICYLSCSPETDIVDGNKTEVIVKNLKSTKLSDKDFKSAKELYVAMVQTADYANFDLAANTFREKLKNNSVVFVNRNEWKEWVTGNLSNTTFTNVGEFESLYDIMIDKLNVLVINNANLYTLLDGADNDQRLLITRPSFGLQPVLIPTPVVPTSCIDACQDAHGAGISSALNDYNNTMANADAANNLYGDLARHWATWRFRQIEVDLAMQYNNCVGGC